MAFITGEKARESERRTSERRRVSVGSWVTSMDGVMVLACQTFDVSARGVRVQPNQTQILPSYIFTMAFRKLDFGYASALSMVLLGLLFLYAILILEMRKRLRSAF